MSPLRMRMLEELQLRNYADFTIERHLAVEHFRSSLRTWGGHWWEGGFHAGYRSPEGLRAF